MAITQEEIAQLLKVNKSTVSRALNRKYGVKDETARNILRIAHKYGYFREKKGKKPAEVTGESKNICFVASPDIAFDSGFYPVALSAVQKEANTRGYHLFFAHSGDASQEKMILDMIEERKTDGLILVGRIDIAFVTNLYKTGIPLVGLDLQVESGEIDNVLVDNIWGAKRAVEYLIELGHREIACAYDPGAFSFRQRYAGYQLALLEHDLPLRKDYTVKVGLNGKPEPGAIKKLLAACPRPTALFACNDYMATNIIQELVAENVKIPEAFSIIGFDNEAIATLIMPPLTTVKVDREKLGRMAFDTLYRRMRKPDREAVQIVLPVELIIRESTRTLA